MIIFTFKKMLIQFDTIVTNVPFKNSKGLAHF